jgi:methyltransferase (TIGR00027 family)
MSAAPIQDVSDTARWVAHFRALESERPDALFRDRHARRLAGDRGQAIAERLPRGPLAWALAVRTRVFDELVLDEVQGGTRVVLNLAAGLDARPYRLQLPADLRWIEVDLPGIIQHKNEILAGERPSCEVERVPLDLADRAARRALLARVGSEAARVLVVTEGLLVYLDDAEVASLAADLHRAFPEGVWLIDNVAPTILARHRRMWGRTLRPANAEMKFAPAEGLAFFESRGWAPRVTRSLLDEARRLRREMPLAPIMRFFASLIPGRQETYRNAVVYALLERVEGGTSRPD